MTQPISRRDVLRSGAAAAGLAAMGLPEWVLPALAQSEVQVPFTDMPDEYVTQPNAEYRFLDIRTIDGLLTPRDQFFAIQHYGQPEIDPATYRLTVSGLVGTPLSISLDDLRQAGGTEVVAGFECSGNSPGRTQGLASNGRWTGLPLRDLLQLAGVQPAAQEVVFFGADKGEEEVEFRGRPYTVEQQFGRSLTIENATKPEPLIAYALNGEPLSRHQGFPVRLIVPGWYGVANVKWLSQIHLQAGRYLGKYQARWYRTLRGETVNGVTQWKETEISRMQLKSVIARVTRAGNLHRVMGFVLNDGTPLRRVEVKADDGPWLPATLNDENTRYSWKLFSFDWGGATPGEHTLVSRVVDEEGVTQPTADDLEDKLTFLENNAQFPRTVMVG